MTSNYEIEQDKKEQIARRKGIAFMIFSVILMITLVWLLSYLWVTLPGWTQFPIGATGLIMLVVCLILFIYGANEAVPDLNS